MDLEDMLADVQEGERPGLLMAAEYFGVENILEFGREIRRDDGTTNTDFDIVTKSGDVVEVFARKGHNTYVRQLPRIARCLERKIADGAQYSGKLYIFHSRPYDQSRRNDRLADFVKDLNEQHPRLYIELIRPEVA